MTNLREAAQMALDALESSRVFVTSREKIKHPEGTEWYDERIEALRAALTQPEQEPVAWRHWLQVDGEQFPQLTLVPRTDKDDPLYTAPPQREWQGLTDEEMMVAAFQAGFDVHEDYDNEDDPDALHWWSEDGEPCDETLHKLRDIIEAKLKEKNS